MRTLQELRNFLLDIIPDIRNGKIEVNKANAICAATNSIINLTKLEVDYFEKQEQEYENDFIVEPIKDVIKKIEQKNHQPNEFDSTKTKI